ncbi:MAG TPA: alternative oxidase [Candidatus Paceibacterota bacterium]|nr:alternative oxidase [Candidatus Paceibacterota bacterium]
MSDEHRAHEELSKQLNDPKLRHEYAKRYDHYQVGWLARFLGWLLVSSGDLVYGTKPSYAKFKAIEVVARVPYQSWEVAAYTLLSAFYRNEKRAIELAKTSAFSRLAQDNETLHVIVLSQIVCKLKQQRFFRHTLVPFLFALFYFIAVYFLYLVYRKAALELNYVFENHAYHQYAEFLERNEAVLKHRICMYEFLSFYGRKVVTEYEFFESVRNDELIHRNTTIRELEARGYFCMPKMPEEDNPQGDAANLARS